MIVPYHSIHKSLLIITQVFHSPYYEDEAQVKCPLSRSDDDSNRFLTSWRVYSPHKSHSLIKWAIGHRIGLSRTNSRVRHAPPVPEDHSGTKLYPRYTQVARRALVVLLNHHQYSAYIGPILGSDSAQASRSEQLILPAKCGACVQHDKRAVNDRSLIDTGRSTTVNTTIRPCPVSSSFPHLVTFHHSIDS